MPTVSTAPAATSAQRGLTLHSKPASSAATANALPSGTQAVANTASAPPAPAGRGRKPSVPSVSGAAQVVSAAPSAARGGRGAGRGTGRGAGGTAYSASKKRLIASSWVDKIDLDLTSDAEAENSAVRPRSRKTSAFTTLTTIDLDEDDSALAPARPAQSSEVRGSSGDEAGVNNTHAGEQRSTAPARPQLQQQHQQQTVSRGAPISSASTASSHAYTGHAPAPAPAANTTSNSIKPTTLHRQQQAPQPQQEEPFVPRFFKRKFGTGPVRLAGAAAAVPTATWYDGEETED